MLKWTAAYDIAWEGIERHPEPDPQYVNFVDLREGGLAIEDFSADPDRCGEKILEAIQMTWIEELD